MKKTIKLIPAIVMLLVSAILVSTSTYAWFSMNTRVNANNMSIKAQVSTQLLIKGSAVGAEYKGAIDFTSSDDSANYATNNTLLTVPAVSYKLRGDTGSKAAMETANTWLKLTAATNQYVANDGTIFGAANGSSYDTWAERITDATGSATYYQGATANADYIKDTFTLKLNGNVAAALDTVAVTITATSSESTFLDADGDGTLDTGDVFISPIYKAVHIALTWGSDGYKEFDLGSGTVTYQTSAGPATVTLGSASEWLNTFTTNEEEVAFTVYIWYDGEDSDCKNSNANIIDQFVYNFQFDLGAGA